MKFNRDSEVKARYALAVLRVAESADRETAARLVQGLARDLSGGKSPRFTLRPSAYSKNWLTFFAHLRRRSRLGQQLQLQRPNGWPRWKETSISEVRRPTYQHPRPAVGPASSDRN